MSDSHLIGLSSAPLNALLNDYHDAYARLIWDAHAAENLGHGVSTMLKHSEGRDVVYATPMFSVYVQDVLDGMKTLDERQKEKLRDRLELPKREPNEAHTEAGASEADLQTNKKMTGFVADATVKNTVYDASFMAYDRGDSEQDIRDLDVQKRLLAAMKAFRKEHKHDDADALTDYFTNPVHVLHSMGLLNDPPVPEQQLNADEITRPTPTTSRPVIVLKNSETSPQKPKQDRYNHP